MKLGKSSVYIRLNEERSSTLQEFLQKQDPKSKMVFSLLEQIRQEEEDRQDCRETLYLSISIEQAIALETLIQAAFPTAETGWTPMHSIRMNLLESITAHFRHVPWKDREGLRQKGRKLAFA